MGMDIMHSLTRRGWKCFGPVWFGPQKSVPCSLGWFVKLWIRPSGALSKKKELPCLSWALWLGYSPHVLYSPSDFSYGCIFVVFSCLRHIYIKAMLM